MTQAISKKPFRHHPWRNLIRKLSLVKSENISRYVYTMGTCASRGEKKWQDIEMYLKVFLAESLDENSFLISSLGIESQV